MIITIANTIMVSKIKVSRAQKNETNQYILFGILIVLMSH